MPNWLQKFTGNAVAPKNFPVAQRSQAQASQHASLPPATIVYAIAAAALIAVAILFLIAGKWLTGAIVLLPAAGLMGFAIHFLKNG